MGRLAKALERLKETPAKEVLEGLYRAGYSETATYGSLPNVFYNNNASSEYVYVKKDHPMELEGIDEKEFTFSQRNGAAA